MTTQPDGYIISFAAVRHCGFKLTNGVFCQDQKIGSTAGLYRSLDANQARQWAETAVLVRFPPAQGWHSHVFYLHPITGSKTLEILE